MLPGLVRDAGMYADTGLELPRGTPSSSPQEVADAVTRAIVRNEAEILVAPRRLRLGAFIVTLAPGFGARMMRRRNASEQGDRLRVRRPRSAERASPGSQPVLSQRRRLR